MKFNNVKLMLAACIAAMAAASAMAADGAKSVVGNPFSALTGQPVGDPHMIEWKGRLYLFAGHDFSPESKSYDLRDWWVWSSSDMLEWKLESVLKPEDTFLKRPYNSCWATFGVPFPDGWRYYFSAGPTEIGVVTAKTPAGPWRDPLGKPLVAKNEYKTASRDPDVLLDDDGSAYIVFGTFKYFIAKLGADGLSLAEKARPVVIDGAFGPYGQNKTDDKPSLHKRNGLYYLSWSSFYAVSTNVYGPYQYRGSVIDAAYVSPKFRRDRIELHYDRHGNFFQFNGQWYYVSNDYSQPGRTRFFRDAVMGYVHYRDNGDIAPVRIDEVGVGQYDAARGEIEAEDFCAVRGATVGECPIGGFELRMGDGNAVRYPNIRNVPENATLEISLWSKAGGGTLEFREGAPDGRILGTLNVRKGRPGHFKKSVVQLQNSLGTLDLWIVAKGGGDELCRIDWFAFRMCPLLAGGASSDGVRTVTGRPRTELKVLMIGNSFSICLLEQFPQVAQSMGLKLDLCSMYIGGCSFERHWSNVEKAGDRSFKPYKIGRNMNGKKLPDMKGNIPQMLSAEKWDVVTIQQASHFSWQPDSYHPYADNLVRKIRELVPQAEIVVQETWSYTPWDVRLAQWKINQDEMYAKLHSAYCGFARTNSFQMIPTGTAVQLYRRELPVVYSENSFGGDPCGAAKFVLGKDGKWKPKGDVFHLNREGHYLQALVWTASLYGVDVTKCQYRPEFIDVARADKMKSCAMKCCSSSM